MFDLFGWLRRRAAEAVVGGVSDALKAVAGEGETPPADLDELRAMLAASAQKSLPAAEEEEEAPAKRRR